MTKHHPKHPEHVRHVPPPPPPAPIERGGDGLGFWLVVFLIIIPLAVCMAIFTTQKHHVVRPQVHVLGASTPKTLDKTPEVLLHEQIARELPIELKPSIELPVEAPAVEAAAASDAPAVVEPTVEAPIAKASPRAPQRLAHHHRHARHKAGHHRRHRHHRRRHHASQFCLTPRPDGLEHDVASCITLDAARLGGLIQ